MNEESSQNPLEEEYKIEQKHEERTELAKSLVESGEVLKFPGLEQQFWERLKADDEEFPGYVTPVDEVIQRFEKEGMKVVFGKNPESGNVYILPGESDDIENDSILPENLNFENVRDERLKGLIALTRELSQREKDRELKIMLEKEVAKVERGIPE